MSTEPTSLGPLEEYDESRSIDMTQARRMLRGRGGADASLEVVRRWTNPVRGCRPLGPKGPTLVLPCVKIGGQLRTMPSWVEAFRAARERVTARGLGPPPLAERPARSREAGRRRAGEVLDRAGVKAETVTAEEGK
jgi:hypothetical protein